MLRCEKVISSSWERTWAQCKHILGRQQQDCSKSSYLQCKPLRRPFFYASIPPSSQFTSLACVNFPYFTHTPAGFFGTNCEMDVDACALPNATCPPKTVCLDLPDGFRYTCRTPCPQHIQVRQHFFSNFSFLLLWPKTSEEGFGKNAQ